MVFCILPLQDARARFLCASRRRHRRRRGLIRGGRGLHGRSECGLAHCIQDVQRLFI